MTPVPRWFRIVAWVMALLFVPCVLLQYNDPDPLRWMAMYGAAGIISTGFAQATEIRAVRRWAFGGALLGVLAAIWGGLLLAGIWGKVGVSDIVLKMSEKGGAVEQEREMGGLALTALWMIFGAAYRFRRAAVAAKAAHVKHRAR